MSKQSSFIKQPKLTHGGTKGHARHARPLCSKRAIHLVLKSSMAQGAMSFLKHKPEIETIIQKHAEANGVRIYEFANCGNHLHFSLRLQNAKLFKKFLRVVTGLIARNILGAEKGKKKLGRTKFWDVRPFSRIVTWGKGFDYLKSYVKLNNLEALGFFKHQPRNHKRRKIFSVSVDPFEIRI